MGRRRRGEAGEALDEGHEILGLGVDDFGGMGVNNERLQELRRRLTNQARVFMDQQGRWAWAIDVAGFSWAHDGRRCAGGGD